MLRKRHRALPDQGSPGKRQGGVQAGTARLGAGRNPFRPGAGRARRRGHGNRGPHPRPALDHGGAPGHRRSPGGGRAKRGCPGRGRDHPRSGEAGRGPGRHRQHPGQARRRHRRQHHRRSPAVFPGQHQDPVNAAVLPNPRCRLPGAVRRWATGGGNPGRRRGLRPRPHRRNQPERGLAVRGQGVGRKRTACQGDEGPQRRHRRFQSHPGADHHRHPAGPGGRRGGGAGDRRYHRRRPIPRRRLGANRPRPGRRGRSRGRRNHS